MHNKFKSIFEGTDIKHLRHRIDNSGGPNVIECLCGHMIKVPVTMLHKPEVVSHIEQFKQKHEKCVSLIGEKQFEIDW